MRNSNRPYVICHMLPPIDGRRETIYSQRVYQQNLDFMYGRKDWRALLTRYPTDMALVCSSLSAEKHRRLRGKRPGSSREKAVCDPEMGAIEMGQISI
jgi:hypothetical protein